MQLKSFRHSAFARLLICALVLTLAPPLLAVGPAFYISFEGTRQGRLTGESQQPNRGLQSEGLKYEYESEVPRDKTTGLPTGRRKHEPVIITKEWGAATPQLFEAMSTGEVLKTVRLDFVRTLPDGTEEIWQTITLSNAQIVALRQYTDEEGKGNYRQLEEISLIFEKIEIAHRPSKNDVVDTWK